MTNYAPASGFEPIDPALGMRIFDAQPRWMKELLWSTPLGSLAVDAVARDCDRSLVARTLRDLERNSAREIWGDAYPTSCVGPLHPRASRRRR